MSLLWWLFAMTAVLATWVTLAGALVGLGLLMLRRTRWQRDSLFIRFWLGLAVTLAGLQIWSLFFAINAVPVLLLLMTGACGWLLYSKGMTARLGATLRGYGWVGRVIPLCMFFLANRAIGPADLYDTRMYHINAMRWANAFPVVPGLANLQRNLAFNNANHLLAAMVNVGPWHGRAQHVVAGLFLFPLMLRGLIGGLRVMRRRSRIEDRYYLLTLPAGMALAMRPEMGSLSSDLPAAVLTLVSIGLLLRLLHRPQWGTNVALLSTLAAAVCCKLSVLGLAGMALPLLAVLPLILTVPWRLHRSITFTTGVMIVFAVPYMARGVILSGYPLFPASFAAQNVDWRYPSEDLSRLRHWIAAHGRGIAIDQTAIGGPWLGHWLTEAGTTEIDRTLPSVVFLLAGGSLLARRAIHSQRWPRRRMLWCWAALPALTATTFWLATSPAIRFGFAFPLSLGAAALAGLLPTRLHRAAFAGIVLLCLLPLWHQAVSGRMDAESIARRLVIFPGKDLGFQPPVRTDYHPFVSRFGVTMFVPASGDFCWNAPLPCTHIPNPDLKMRNPDDIAAGFITDRFSATPTEPSIPQN